MLRRLANIYRLGIKELWSLARDPLLIVLVLWSFTVMIFIAARALPETLQNASIAIADEDSSPLSAQIVSAFYPPHFNIPSLTSVPGLDPGMDQGLYTFTLDIPPNFQRDVLAGRSPAIQLNIDATRMSQAFIGNGDIQEILWDEVGQFVQRYRNTVPPMPVELVVRNRFNPNLERSWFGAVVEIINQVTLLSMLLTGAALIREREHGTVEHLLVMPVTPAEIMLAKVWAMSVVVLVATAMSLYIIVQGALHIPIEGSVPLFLVGVALDLFAATSLGIFLATVARSMPQFSMLLILFLLPLQMLSGGITPRESMPEFVQNVMLGAPTTHFVLLAQAILYRGAGIEVVWKPFLALLAIGSVLFAFSLTRFRKMIGQMA